MEEEKKLGKKRSFKETVILMLKRRWLSNTSQTIAIVIILVGLFIGINLYVQNLGLEDIDITDNKIHSLSDASKTAISKLDEDVKIYIYGFTETDSLMSIIKQYAKANEKITYEILTEESNLAKVKEYELSEGYQIIVLETATNSKTIDVLNDFYSYDYTTGQQVDLTEQRLTNSILGLTTENKPVVYFTLGHKEYGIDDEIGLVLLKTYLTNESYIAKSLNLLTVEKVPDDCSLLAIMNPETDFFEMETNSILDYINKGGDLLITSDVLLPNEKPNLQKIYDVYGVKINNTGYIYEKGQGRAVSNYPNIILPDMSINSDITTDIYVEGGSVCLPFAGKLEFVSSEEFNALKVEKEDILTTSSNAYFIEDITQNPEELINDNNKGKFTIASLLTKTITPKTEEEDKIESQLFIVANSVFATDYTLQQLESMYPMFAIANNKDFILNAVSKLTAKEDVLKIRKDVNTSTYLPTVREHAVVLAIIFTVPIAIILTGIYVWNYRRRKR